MKYRINITMVNGTFIYPVDMTNVQVEQYAYDNSFCIGASEQTLAAPIATDDDYLLLNSDEDLRIMYEDNMTSVMTSAQVDALGEPQGFRFLQGMSRLSHLINARQQGATLSQEEIDFIDGSEAGLDYQEINATAFQSAKADLVFLTGQAIVDYPMPDFSMSPSTHSGYQPYLDYLNLGYPL